MIKLAAWHILPECFAKSAIGEIDLNNPTSVDARATRPRFRDSTARLPCRSLHTCRLSFFENKKGKTNHHM